MPPRRRNASAPSEAARLTDILIDEGFTKRQIAEILGRNSATISHFYSRGPHSGDSYVPALISVVQEVQAGGPRDIESLKRGVSGLVTRRRTKAGRLARVRGKDSAEHKEHDQWRSGVARAGKQHISSGASRLRPVVESAAGADGRIAFTIRASKGRFLIDSGDDGDSPRVRKHVVQRPDGTEERSYGDGGSGLNAREWQQRVAHSGGDVSAAINEWMVETGRLAEGASVTHLEVRGWKP